MRFTPNCRHTTGLLLCLLLPASRRVQFLTGVIHLCIFCLWRAGSEDDIYIPQAHLVPKDLSYGSRHSAHLTREGPITSWGPSSLQEMES